MNLRYLPEAEQELEAAADRYARRSVRTMYRFLGATAQRLNLILFQPRVFSRVARPPAGRDVREVQIGQYSYKLVYEVLSTEVLILAVQHVRQNSQPWRRRTP